jgi:hypothetical protein
LGEANGTFTRAMVTADISAKTATAAPLAAGSVSAPATDHDHAQEPEAGSLAVAKANQLPALADGVLPLAPQLLDPVLADHLGPDLLATDTSARRVRAAQRVLRASVAVLRAEMDGTTVKTLAQVMSPVPIDPWDGQPIRFDPVKRLVWSIGSDRSDDGGQGTSVYTQVGDQAFRLPNTR